MGQPIWSARTKTLTGLAKHEDAPFLTILVGGASCEDGLPWELHTCTASLLVGAAPKLMALSSARFGKLPILKSTPLYARRHPFHGMQQRCLQPFDDDALVSPQTAHKVQSLFF